MYEKKGDTEVHYAYDGEGNPRYIQTVASDGTVEEGYLVTNTRGDVVAIVDGDGNIVAKYTYDAWGNELSVTNASGEDISNVSGLGYYNSLRYRGYYYDGETCLYYLQSRYYDPQVKRFINADDARVLNISGDLYNKNVFAYCDNNAIIRRDNEGDAWDVAIDVASIVVGVGNVVKNPKNPVAWLSLGVDTACAFVPFLTGGGAAVRGIAKRGNAIDTAKKIYRSASKSSDIRKATGSYVIKFANKKVYVGKGGYKRAIESAKRLSKKSEVVSIEWKKAKNTTQAFINEYKDMCKYGGLKGKRLYNKIWSPGRSKYYKKYGKYIK